MRTESTDCFAKGTKSAIHVTHQCMLYTNNWWFAVFVGSRILSENFRRYASRPYRLRLFSQLGTKTAIHWHQCMLHYNWWFAVFIGSWIPSENFRRCVNGIYSLRLFRRRKQRLQYIHCIIYTPINKASFSLWSWLGSEKLGWRIMIFLFVKHSACSWITYQNWSSKRTFKTAKSTCTDENA